MCGAGRIGVPPAAGNVKHHAKEVRNSKLFVRIQVMLYKDAELGLRRTLGCVFSGLSLTFLPILNVLSCGGWHVVVPLACRYSHTISSASWQCF
jgi:hypothetical protein